MRLNSFNKLYKKTKLRNFPSIIDIELTNECNLNCLMCSRRLMARDKGYISRDTFTKIIRQCKGKDVGIRFIRWGEPFLHPHILDFCKQVKEAGLPLHITTNGLLMSESQMRAIVDMQVDSIIFSMQGIDEEAYEFYRGGIYNLFKTNIKKLIELRGDMEKPYIHITCTIDDVDRKYNGYFKSQWKNIADEVTVGTTNWTRITGNRPEGVEHIKCKEPYYKLGIDWDGKVTACCGDYDNFLTIGNLNNHTIFWIWNHSQRLKCIRNILDNMEHKVLTLCNECYPAYGNLSNNNSES